MSVVTSPVRTHAIPLPKERIEAIFASAQHQSEYVLALYRLAIPDFDNVIEVDGFPRAHPTVIDCVFALAIEFDRRHHPNVLPGGMWLNHGFSADPTLPPWTVSVEGVPVRYKE